MTQIADWLSDHPAVTTAAVVVSIALFVGTIVLTPRFVAGIPQDYFAHRRRPKGALASAPAPVRVGVLALRSVLGVLLILAGVAMLVLPGQGLLTVLAGVMLLEFPGKYRLEKRLAAVGWVRRVLNRMRRKRGKPPLTEPDDAGGR